MGFVFIYALSFLSLAIALSLTGEDLLTSLSCAIAAISNAGMGFGDILGPRGNFASMTESAQWLLSFGMLSGRLEILPFLVIFSPHFWRV